MTFGRRYWTVHRGLLESASGGEENARVQLTRIANEQRPTLGTTWRRGGRPDYSTMVWCGF